jgi:hypothetical protein
MVKNVALHNHVTLKTSRFLRRHQLATTQCRRYTQQHIAATIKVVFVMTLDDSSSATLASIGGQGSNGPYRLRERALEHLTRTMAICSCREHPSAVTQISFWKIYKISGLGFNSAVATPFLGRSGRVAIQLTATLESTGHTRCLK